MTETKNDTLETDIIDSNWILLEICSTISYLIHKDLVQDICDCDAGKEVQVYTNDVNQYHKYTATMKMLPSKYFYIGKSLVNTL